MADDQAAAAQDADMQSGKSTKQGLDLGSSSGGKDTKTDNEQSRAEADIAKAMEGHNRMNIYGDSVCLYTAHVDKSKISAFRATGFSLPDGKEKDDWGAACIGTDMLLGRDYSAVTSDPAVFGKNTQSEASAARLLLLQRLTGTTNDDAGALQEAIDQFNVAADVYAKHLAHLSGDEHASITAHGAPFQISDMSSTNGCKTWLYDDSEFANRGNDRSLIVRPGGIGKATFKPRVDPNVPSLAFAATWRSALAVAAKDGELSFRPLLQLAVSGEGSTPWYERYGRGLKESVASRIVTEVADRLKKHDDKQKSPAGEDIEEAMQAAELDGRTGESASMAPDLAASDDWTKSALVGRIAERAALVEELTDQAVSDCLSLCNDGKLQVNPERTFAMTAGRDIVVTLDGLERMRLEPTIELSGLKIREVPWRRSSTFEDSEAMESMTRRLDTVDREQPDLSKTVASSFQQVERALRGKDRDASYDAMVEWAMAAERRLTAALDLDMVGEPKLGWHTQGTNPCAVLHSYKCDRETRMLTERRDFGCGYDPGKAGTEPPADHVLDERGSVKRYIIDGFQTASDSVDHRKPYVVLARHRLKLDKEGIAPDTQLLAYPAGSHSQEDGQDDNVPNLASQDAATHLDPSETDSLLYTVRDAMLTQATDHSAATEGERPTVVPHTSEPVEWDVRHELIASHDQLTSERNAALTSVCGLVSDGSIPLGQRTLRSGR